MGYYHGPQGEVYFVDNGRLDAPTPTPSAGHHHHLASHHGSSSGRPPYLKENVPPHPYHPSSMYSQRSSMERHGHGHGHGRGHAHMQEGGHSMYPPSASRVADYVPPRVDEMGVDSMRSSYDALARENHHMREQLQEKDMVVSSLQERVAYLEKQISELRQLPTGKISHIPIE